MYDVLRQYALMPGKVHADDIPVPVQEPGSGKTRTARLWVYVRDDRNAGSQMPPAVWFAYSPDRKGIHPQNHLAGYSGVLQADAYGGYRALYESGRITEAACMAHARRKIHDVHDPGQQVVWEYLVVITGQRWVEQRSLQPHSQE